MLKEVAAVAVFVTCEIWNLDRGRQVMASDHRVRCPPLKRQEGGRVAVFLPEGDDMDRSLQDIDQEAYCFLK